MVLSNMFFEEHDDDVWLNETSAFNAVIAMSLTTILITLIVMGIICVFFVYFERIFHQKKSFCTTTFLYTITCKSTLNKSVVMTLTVFSLDFDLCNSN